MNRWTMIRHLLWKNVQEVDKGDRNGDPEECLPL